jgi:hypothetical protein
MLGHLDHFRGINDWQIKICGVVTRQLGANSGLDPNQNNLIATGAGSGNRTRDGFLGRVIPTACIKNNPHKRPPNNCS